jgi:hypothetical protein
MLTFISTKVQAPAKKEGTRKLAIKGERILSSVPLMTGKGSTRQREMKENIFIDHLVQVWTRELGKIRNSIEEAKV